MFRSKWGIAAFLNFLFLIILIVSCHAQAPADWPDYVKNSLWVTDNATDIKYYRIAESYQVMYQVRECYPAKSFMRQMINTMNNQHWKRLDHDFLDSRIKANYVKDPSGFDWGSSYTDLDGSDVTQWIDDWQDKSKNYVRFFLVYKDNKESWKSCNLKVVVIYIPAECVTEE